MNARELENIVAKMLSEGVPPGVVARVFDLDHDLVRETQSGVRVRLYSTDDMTEYTEHMQWKAVEEALRIIESGSATEKQKVLGMVLGKQVALSARRTPESVRNSQDAVVDMMERMRTGKPKKASRSKFIARLENKDAGA